MYCSDITNKHEDGDGEFPIPYNCPNIQAIEEIEPLMMLFGVDIFFAGHEHTYESNWPLFNSTVLKKSYNNPTGPVHITTGDAGSQGLDIFGPPLP